MSVKHTDQTRPFTLARIRNVHWPDTLASVPNRNIHSSGAFVLHSPDILTDVYSYKHECWTLVSVHRKLHWPSTPAALAGAYWHTRHVEHTVVAGLFASSRDLVLYGLVCASW